MRYAMLISSDETAAISGAERSRRDAALTRLLTELRAEGVLAGAERLHRSETATTVRCWDGGDVILADGPLAEPAEQLTGLLIVDCANHDAALELATRIPAAWYGTVEVRQVQESDVRR